MKLKQRMFMKTFMKPKNLFDLSDYPEESKLFGPVNNKVIGKIKNLGKDKLMSEFVRLKSGMYSLVIVNNEEIYF